MFMDTGPGCFFGTITIKSAARAALIILPLEDMLNCLKILSFMGVICKKELFMFSFLPSSLLMISKLVN